MSYVSGVGSVGFAGYATNYSGTEYDPGNLLSSDPNATGPGSVRFVQQMLVELGALPAVNAKGKSNVDGLFGPGTSAAYQAVTGEPKVSGQSLAVLGTKYAAKLGGLTPTPPPAPPGPPSPTPPAPGVQTCPPGTVGIPPFCASLPGGGGGGVVPPPAPKEEPKDKTLMYVGIGAGVLAVGGLLVFALSSGKKKKKAVENKRSSNMTRALRLAAESADMKRRGDYNYARLIQIRDEIFGLVGKYDKHGKPTIPASVRRAMQP